MFGIYLRSNTKITLSERFTRLSNELKKRAHSSDPELEDSTLSHVKSKSNDEFNSVQQQVSIENGNVTVSITADKRSRNLRQNYIPLICFNCGGEGHKRFECYWNPRSQGAQYSYDQRVYGEPVMTDHRSRDYKPNYRPMKCFNCGVEGHKKYECDLPPKNKKKAQSSHDHVEQQEPDMTDHRSRGFQQNSRPVICYNCGVEGHKRYKCDLPRKIKKEAQSSHDHVTLQENETSEQQQQRDNSKHKTRTFYNRQMNPRQSESNTNQEENLTSDNKIDTTKSHQQNQSHYDHNYNPYYMTYYPNQYYNNNNYSDYYNHYNYFYYDYQEPRWNWKPQEYYINHSYHHQNPKRKISETDHNDDAYIDDDVKCLPEDGVCGDGTGR